MTAETATTKAALLKALQERVAALEKVKNGTSTNNATTTVSANQSVVASPPLASNGSTAVTLTLVAPSPTHSEQHRSTTPSSHLPMPLPSPSPAHSSSASSLSVSPINAPSGPVATTPRSALEEARALLAAKIAAKEAAKGQATKLNGSNLSAAATPFVPSSSSAAAASSSTSSHTAAASSSVVKPAASGAVIRKVQLCRSWLTCTFGARCRFHHPTIPTEPLFEYGGRILLHLNATERLAAMRGSMVDTSISTSASSTAMPPVLLLVLALLVQARSSPTQPPSMPLTALWTSLRDQLVGMRDLPPNQDDLLNTMGLPTTAAILVRTVDGATINSTDAFRNMYACVFSVSRLNGVFVVSHQWDDVKRMRLQQDAEELEMLIQQKKKSKNSTSAAASSASSSAPRSSSTSMIDVDHDEINRKRKRVPDSELEGHGDASRNIKQRTGEVWPEERPSLSTPAAAVASSSSSSSSFMNPPRSAASQPQPGSTYAMNAGEHGGVSSFVRGGIVTELSLLAPASQLRQHQQQQQQQPVEDPFEDAFTRAIRRSREVSQHATYTLRTNRISSGKGYDMLSKMNWRNGQGLGKRQQGRLEPIEVKFRADGRGL